MKDKIKHIKTRDQEIDKKKTINQAIENKKHVKKEKKKKKITKSNAMKKVNPQVIAKIEEEAKYTRDFQSRFDNKFNGITMKFNFLPCAKCGQDIHINNVVFFTEPRSGRKFITVHKTCATTCNKNQVVYELTEKTAEELQKDDINTFTILS